MESRHPYAQWKFKVVVREEKRRHLYVENLQKKILDWSISIKNYLKQLVSLENLNFEKQKELRMDKKQLLERTVKELRSVLISAPRGVALRLLLNDFKVVLGHELPYRQLDFQRVEDFIKSVPHCVRVAPGANGELTCFAVADESTSQIARFVALQKKPKLKKSNAPPSVRKSAVLTAFTKKSNKYGPSSHARPRSSYNKNKFSGPGNVYTGGPRQAKPQYGKGIDVYWYNIAIEFKVPKSYCYIAVQINSLSCVLLSPYDITA